MKRFFCMLTSLMSLALICSSFSSFIISGDDDDPEEIIITEQSGQNGPTSLGGTQVQAFKIGNAIIVQAWCISGTLQVTVIGRTGMTETTVDSTGGYAQAILDVSSLPSGNYLLLISTPGIFYGYFSK